VAGHHVKVYVPGDFPPADANQDVFELFVAVEPLLVRNLPAAGVPAAGALVTIFYVEAGLLLGVVYPALLHPRPNVLTFHQ
jgi:hypothetical protein